MAILLHPLSLGHALEALICSAGTGRIIIGTLWLDSPNRLNARLQRGLTGIMISRHCTAWDPHGCARAMTIRLRPLVLSANFGDEAIGPPGAAGETLNNSDEPRCAFCGMHSGRWQRLVAAPRRGHDCAAACVLCYLCRHLERPRIDEEAALVWLPEMSQPALNVTMREIHLQLRALGEDLHDAGRLRLDTPERLRLYYARSALSARAAAAASRLGTDKPSELAGGLCRLSPGAYANRAKLLDGVRLLPLGRFYAGNKDVYPEIVDSWREISKPPPGLAPVPPTPPFGA